MTKTQKEIIEIIKENAEMTIESIEQRLGKEISTIKKAIRKLKDFEIIERVGSDKAGYWKVL